MGDVKRGRPPSVRATVAEPPHNAFPDDPPAIKQAAQYVVGEIPLDSVLRSIPSIEEQIATKGARYDPNLGDRLLTLKMRVVIERALQSADIPLEKKVDWAIKGIGLFEGSKSTLWLKDDKPTTQDEVAIEKEKRERAARIKLLLGKYEGLTEAEAKRIDVTINQPVVATDEA